MTVCPSFLAMHSVSYRVPRQHTLILNNISLNLCAGERVGLIGASGSGKTTLLSLLLALIPATQGDIYCQQRPLRPTSVRKLRWYRRLVQYVPQDPAASLNPFMTVRETLSEPLRYLAMTRPDEALIHAALKQVQLDPALANRAVSTLSGGQAQRVAIARAMGLQPAFLLADEPVSGLDMPLREEMTTMLARLADESGMGILMVSHDISSVAALCSRTLVMDKGQIIEDSPTSRLLISPAHAETRRLIAAIPRVSVSNLDEKD